jgi:predicted SAM-dependent methyltransferase
MEWTWRHLSRKALKDAVDLERSKCQKCRLNIGTGHNPLVGWFNTDLEPIRSGVYYLDATVPFPLDDHSIDYIFSEHMIEHLSFECGEFMLAECLRVLRPGGVIRIATPDLRKVISLYSSPALEVARYKAWVQAFSNLPRLPRPECLIINHIMHAWGHRFIYDESTLSTVMLRAGFVNIFRFNVMESDEPELRNLEQHGKAPIGDFANGFETMVLQGRRP